MHCTIFNVLFTGNQRAIQGRRAKQAVLNAISNGNDFLSRAGPVPYLSRCQQK